MSERPSRSKMFKAFVKTMNEDAKAKEDKEKEIEANKKETNRKIAENLTKRMRN